MTQRIGIQRRVLLAAVLTASALALPGCARYYYGAAASSDPVDLMASNHGAADALLLQVPLDPGAPVLVGTVVQLDRLDESSRLGRLVAGDADSYRYLAESIRMHPGQAELKALMKVNGFGHVDFHNLSGGVVALHVGIKCA